MSIWDEEGVMSHRAYEKPVVVTPHALVQRVILAFEIQMLGAELRLRAKIADDQVRSIEEAQRRPIQNIRFTV